MLYLQARPRSYRRYQRMRSERDSFTCDGYPQNAQVICNAAVSDAMVLEGFQHEVGVNVSESLACFESYLAGYGHRNIYRTPKRCLFFMDISGAA